MKEPTLADVLKVNSAEDARSLAIDWQAWQAEQSLSYDELLSWQAVFEHLAEEYNLTDEFVENGII